MKRRRREPPLRDVHPVYRRIYDVVVAIPRGRVATYGQVAAVAGLPGRARQVGYALHALPLRSRVPWQRVVNSAGMVSIRSEAGGDERQREALAAEGIMFDQRGRIDLHRFGWRPR
ncbi:MAG: MGMT family protein [Planctomycetes bacterium]|nr:MGMT family protein [Planctomycetota bacterium]